MSLIEAIVWDLGNVLVSWNPMDLYEQLISDKDKAQYWVDSVFSMEWNQLADSGMSYAQANQVWLNKFDTDYPENKLNYPPYKKLVEAYGHYAQEAHAYLLADSIALRDGLRADGFITMALTNFSYESLPKVSAAHGNKLDREFFDYFMMSSEVRLTKPSRDIFNLLIDEAVKQFGIDAGQILFIDDSEKNVIAAGQCGLNTIHYQSAQDLRHRLTHDFGIKNTHIPVCESRIKGKNLGKLPFLR